MVSENDESVKKTPEETVVENNKPEETPQGNNVVSPLDENSGDDSAKGQDNNDEEREVKKLAERALNAILPEKKIEIMEKLARYGMSAVPYLTEIGYKSRWPRVKKRALDLINEIYKHHEGSG